MGDAGDPPTAVERFIGTYSVARTIHDRRGGQSASFNGQAVIEAIQGVQGGAHYSEKGALQIGAGPAFAAERQYLWRMAGARIAVDFADGRAFHDFDPVAGGQATEHLCGEDMYRGGYDFSEWTCWSVTWDVTGPRKDYRSVTLYSPVR